MPAQFPELKYRIIGEPLWDGRLNITSETELAYQNRVFDRLSPTNRSFDGTSSSKAQTDFLGRGDLLTAERVLTDHQQDLIQRKLSGLTHSI